MPYIHKHNISLLAVFMTHDGQILMDSFHISIIITTAVSKIKDQFSCVQPARERLGQSVRLRSIESLIQAGSVSYRRPSSVSFRLEWSEADRHPTVWTTSYVNEMLMRRL